MDVGGCDTLSPLIIEEKSSSNLNLSKKCFSQIQLPWILTKQDGKSIIDSVIDNVDYTTVLTDPVHIHLVEKIVSGKHENFTFDKQKKALIIKYEAYGTSVTETIPLSVKKLNGEELFRKHSTINRSKDSLLIKVNDSFRRLKHVCNYNKSNLDLVAKLITKIKEGKLTKFTFSQYDKIYATSLLTIFYVIDGVEGKIEIEFYEYSSRDDDCCIL